MNDFVWLMIGVALGMVIALIAVGSSILARVKDVEDKIEIDRDIRIYVPAKKKERHTLQEMAEVLSIVRMGCCNYEKEVINDVLNLLQGEEENGKKMD